jgi:hypothetical protein
MASKSRLSTLQLNRELNSCEFAFVGDLDDVVYRIIGPSLSLHPPIGQS